ncbi:hypothetical protein EZS27_021352 [termite gut metagenome]|uniref:Uncharacterized protein n=1 Tax=termite gut metagenome TaxID=433724 RepID=A0A5J4R9A2_9ZZZZ
MIQKYGKSLFIGIDFSKDKFDVSVIHPTHVGACVYHCFDNTKEGCKELLKWVRTQAGCPPTE